MQVYDAFAMAWSEERGPSGVLRLPDLEAFVGKCELGDDFLARLRAVLQVHV